MTRYFTDILFTLLLFLNINTGFSRGQWKPYLEDGLPPMYAMEDFFTCEKQQGTFCKAEIIIVPNDPNSTLAEEIKKSHDTWYRFRRSSLYRMLCIPKEITDAVAVREYINIMAAKEVKEYNVSTNVFDYSCNVNRRFNILDYLLVFIVLVYFWLLYKATIYDVKRKKSPDYPISKYDKWLKIFSIRENWKKINAENTNPDYQKLKSIQGLRFFNTIVVITCHTKMSFTHLYLDNPQDLEQTYASKFARYSYQIDFHILQIFFMISTFLLTNQIYELHRKHGYFSLTHCFKMYLNRICRFLPTIALLILLTPSCIKTFPQGTVLLDQINIVLDGVFTSWWATVLQVNYVYNFAKICMAGTWYLSVDTLMYAITIAILYIQLKFKLDLKKILAITFIGTTLNYAHIIYSGGYDIMFRPDPENTKRIYESEEFQKLYLSPFSNLNTCFIGIAMGSIYFHTKNKKMKISAVFQVLWLLTFLLIPGLVIYASTYRYTGISRAIVGSLIKPLFGLVFGVGILGMSLGLGGVVKRIFEWDFLVKMSNVTYSTYLYHFFLVFTKGMFTRGLVHYEQFDMVWCLFQDVIVSFLAGIVAAVLIEQPGLTLQKMYIPQIKTPETKRLDGNEIKVNNIFKVVENIFKVE